MNNNNNNNNRTISYGAFETMLGISEPLYIEEIAFQTEQREMHIRVNFRKGSKFTCPKCGKEENAVGNTTDKVWRTLDMHHYKTYIHFRTPYIKCDSGECGTPLWTPPWANSNSGFSRYFEAFVIELVMAGMPVSEIADMVDEHDTRLWRFINKYTDEEYAKKDYSNVTRTSFDETSRKRGHAYFTIGTDLDTHNVIAVLEGKGADAIKDFADEMKKHNLNAAENVIEVSIDMSPSFISGVGKYLPNASITFDKFHIIKPLQEALDKLRREEQAKDKKLFRKRWSLLKNPDKLTENQQKDLEEITKQYPKLGRGYRMVQTFKDILNSNLDIQEATQRIKKWLGWAARCRLEPMKEYAKLVKSHWDGILHYFESRVTNGIAEGINSVIQSAKRSARGYRNARYFKSIILLRCAALPKPQVQ